MKNRSGFSLLEVVVSSLLMLMLSGALFIGWASGSQAWLVSSRRSQLMTESQIFFRRVEKDLESSSASSLDYVTLPSGCLSYASPYGLRDTANSTLFDASNSNGEVHWPKAVVIYHQMPLRELWWREVAIPPASSAYQVPTPLSQIDLGSGPQPLPSYATGGSKIVSHVDRFDISRESRNLRLTLELKSPQQRGQSEGRYISVTLLRN
jgi:hypothetical protein